MKTRLKPFDPSPLNYSLMSTLKALKATLIMGTTVGSPSAQVAECTLQIGAVGIRHTELPAAIERAVNSFEAMREALRELLRDDGKPFDTDNYGDAVAPEAWEKARKALALADGKEVA